MSSLEQFAGKGDLDDFNIIENGGHFEIQDSGHIWQKQKMDPPTKKIQPKSLYHHADFHSFIAICRILH